MTPRTDIVAIRADASLDDALEVVEEASFSRYPVFAESIDNIIGMLHVKDLLGVLREKLDLFTVRDVMRDVHMVPGSREVEEVLADFKKRKEHMAIVLDEYGGTAGLVTMEDLLEEIVGEILDEYDETVEVRTPSASGGVTLVAGASNVREMNEIFGLSVPEEDYTTLGGYVFGVLGRLPLVGDRVTGGGATFVVRAMNEIFGLSVPEEDYTTLGGYVFGVLGRLPLVGDRVTGGGATFVVRAMDGRRIETLALEKAKGTSGGS